MANPNFLAGGRRRRLYRPRPGSNFYFRFQHKGRDIELSTFTTIESVAKERAKAKIEAVINGRAITTDISFDELVSRFTASRIGKGEGTVKNDRAFANILRETFAETLSATSKATMQTPVKTVGSGDLNTWLNTQAAKREWKNRTFNHYRLWLWQIFDFGVDNRLIAENENPFRTKKIKRRRPNAVVRLIPTLEQFEQIISQVRSADGEDFADFIEFLGGAGVGQAEAAPLEWTAIGRKIKFVRRKTGIPFEVPIYQWLAPLTIRLRAKRSGMRVFNVTDAGKALRRACDALNLPRFTQRGLRAMLIKRLYDADIPVKRIAEWQGHQDGGKLIQEIYTEVFSDNDVAAEEADLAKVGGAVDLTAIDNLDVLQSVA